MYVCITLEHIWNSTQELKSLTTSKVFELQFGTFHIIYVMLQFKEIKYCWRSISYYMFYCLRLMALKVRVQCTNTCLEYLDRMQVYIVLLLFFLVVKMNDALTIQTYNSCFYVSVFSIFCLPKYCNSIINARNYFIHTTYKKKRSIFNCNLSMKVTQNSALYTFYSYLSSSS